MNKILLILIGMMLFINVGDASNKGKINEGGLVWKEQDILIRLWEADKTKALKKYQELLKNGTKYQKEAVLNIFQEKQMRELVPNVIEAILDDTPSAPLGDTGWGRVYHQAATIMCWYAQKIDGKSQDQRGRDKYSFFSDVGTADAKRRKEVYNNWLKWWEKNKKN